jgi:hypothetical protein
MSNRFKPILKSLIDDSSGLVAFRTITIERAGLVKNIVEIKPDKRILEFTHELAVEKAQKIMPQNQNLETRSIESTVGNLCRGILGETALNLVFAETIAESPSEILQFDLERPSFDYVPNEYDLMFRGRRLEVRTSNNPFARIQDYLWAQERGVICRYTNAIKTKELRAAYYFAVVYDYPGASGAVADDKKISFLADMDAGNLRMYLAGAVNDSERETHSIVGTMGQANTNYEYVPFSKCRSVLQVMNEMKGLS